VRHPSRRPRNRPTRPPPSGPKSRLPVDRYGMVTTLPRLVQLTTGSASVVVPSLSPASSDAPVFLALGPTRARSPACLTTTSPTSAFPIRLIGFCGEPVQNRAHSGLGPSCSPTSRNSRPARPDPKHLWPAAELTNGDTL
jgi:hypothetical protein